MQAALPQAEHRPWRERWLSTGEWILFLALLGEIAVFSATATNFFTLGNFFEVIRFSVELGRLAAAVAGAIPAQVPLFILVFAGYVLLLHRSTIGRGLYAIGFIQSGARYAGIPVARRIGLVYFLSGLVSSVAAIVYAAHLGQAKSDSGV